MWDKWDYGNLVTHRKMLRDRVRCEVFRKAIFETVKPGHIILDMGAGTGILSIFAAQAGARKVYAVERARIAEFARQMVRMNGAEDCVEVIQADMETVELPEQVDVVVSEWLGCLGVDENLLPSVLVARDRWLKPGGIMLPERVTAWLAPIEHSYIESDLARWVGRPYGVDLSLVAHGIAQEVWFVQNDIKMDNLLAEPQQMWMTDVYHCSIEEVRLPFRASFRFPVTRGGKLSALAGWFRAEFPNGMVLTNAPDAPDTHWGRAQFNLGCSRKVGRGMEIGVEFTCEPVDPGKSRYHWAVRVGDGPWEDHDTRQGWS